MKKFLLNADHLLKIETCDCKVNGETFYQIKWTTTQKDCWWYTNYFDDKEARDEDFVDARRALGSSVLFEVHEDQTLMARQTGEGVRSGPSPRHP